MEGFAVLDITGKFRAVRKEIFYRECGIRQIFWRRGCKKIRYARTETNTKYGKFGRNMELAQRGCGPAQCTARKGTTELEVQADAGVWKDGIIQICWTIIGDLVCIDQQMWQFIIKWIDSMLQRCFRSFQQKRNISRIQKCTAMPLSVADVKRHSDHTLPTKSHFKFSLAYVVRTRKSDFYKFFQEFSCYSWK